ncbi:MAG: hypothetical protein ACO1OB_18610 [Archangium sp.]
MKRWWLVLTLFTGCTITPIRDTNRGELFLSVEGSDEPPAAMPSFDLGEVMVGGRKTVTIRATNVGIDALNVSGVFLGAVGNGSFYVRDASGELEPGQSLTAAVTFSPATKGAQQTQVTFSHDADSALPSLQLTGTGI